MGAQPTKNKPTRFKMRSKTPALNVGHTVAGARPTSPPETPRTTSPTLNKIPASEGTPSPKAAARQGEGSRSSIRPLGGGKFSYTRGLRAEDISPRSLHSSGDESESSDSPPQSPISDLQGFHRRLGFKFTTAAAAIAAIGATIRIDEADFAVEEISDCSLDSDEEIPLDIIRPYAIDEYGGGSERSRSGSCRTHDIEPITTRVQDFNPFDDSGSDVEDDDEFSAQLKRERQARRLRRMKSGSISKRTISERDSESDREDLMPWLEVTDAGMGPGHRRVRRRGENRSSIQFTGPLPERIEELREPNSDDEIILDDSEIFARELPYFSFMEIDHA